MGLETTFNHRRGSGTESFTKRRIRNRDHMGNGWPHYSARHLCMCLDECCNDDRGKCYCRSCPCMTDPKIHGTGEGK